MAQENRTLGCPESHPGNRGEHLAGLVLAPFQVIFPEALPRGMKTGRTGDCSKRGLASGCGPRKESGLVGKAADWESGVQS